jgi:hypothetical protein
MTTAKIIFAALVLASAGLGASAASADTAPLANHGRRAEIYARLAEENVQIRDAARAGLITPQQNGHLTHHQQRLLNREENAVGGEIAR